MYSFKDDPLEVPQDIADLRNEICAARQVLQRALDAGHNGTVLAAAREVGRLSQAFDSHNVRLHQHLERSAVVAFAKGVAELLADCVDTLPLDQITKDGFLDDFLRQLGERLDIAANSAKKVSSPLLLEKTS